MATEWKDYNYSPLLKGCALLTSWVSFTVLSLCSVMLMMHPEMLSIIVPGVTGRSPDGGWWLFEFDHYQLGEMTVYGWIGAFVMLSLCVVYLMMTAGRRERGGPVVLTQLDRVWSDVHTGLVLVAAGVVLLLLANGGDVENGSFWFLLGFLSFVSAMIGSSWVLSMVRLWKAGQLFSHSLLGNLAHVTVSAGRTMRDGWRLATGGRRAWIPLLLNMVGYALANGLLGVLMGLTVEDGNEGALLLLFFIAGVFNLIAFVKTVRWAVSLARLLQSVRDLAHGDLMDWATDAIGAPMFREAVTQLQAIRNGQRHAVEEAVRAERMRTDLITNVSHDLKTPLTSIVNYVDLLAKEELHNERASGYVKVLEEKAARMKQLIEDLVEASKASSGNLGVQAELLDLHQLVQQAIGEFENRFWLTGLDVRLKAEPDIVPVWADGRHVWRILENLLTNVCKYALNGTRVYVQVGMENGMSVLSVKNVSASPLDMPVDQLTERFVRGDESRTTEGSGLGLSIAKSLALLLGGRLVLDIDGDLFKATVFLPIEEPAETVEPEAAGRSARNDGPAPATNPMKRATAEDAPPLSRSKQALPGGRLRRMLPWAPILLPGANTGMGTRTNTRTNMGTAARTNTETDARTNTETDTRTNAGTRTQTIILSDSQTGMTIHVDEKESVGAGTR